MGKHKHTSAEAACVRYVEAQREIKRLSTVIGEHFSACYQQRIKGVPEFEMHKVQGEPCLAALYKPEVREPQHQYDSGGVDYLSDAEIREELAKCPHCLAAHEAIQQRKAARKAFGAAKRAIGTVGRAALAKARSEA